MRFIDKRGKLTTNPDPQRVYARRPVGQTQGIADHHTAGKAVWDAKRGEFVTHERVAAYHATPSTPGAKNHLSDRGAPGIAYTFFIEPDGTIVQCWDLDVATWSQGWSSRPGDENAQFIAICHAGNMTGPHNRGAGSHRPTPHQLLASQALALHLTGEVRDPRLPDDLFDAVPFGPSARTTHSALGKPACPGEDIEVLARVAAEYDGWWKDDDAPLVGHELDSVVGRQKALVELGYDLGRWGADGDWGVASRAALQAFQADHGLKVDGTWGPKTQAAMAKALVALGG